MITSAQRQTVEAIRRDRPELEHVLRVAHVNTLDADSQDPDFGDGTVVLVGECINGSRAYFPVRADGAVPSTDEPTYAESLEELLFLEPSGIDWADAQPITEDELAA